MKKRIDPKMEVFLLVWLFSIFSFIFSFYRVTKAFENKKKYFKVPETHFTLFFECERECGNHVEIIHLRVSKRRTQLCISNCMIICSNRIEPPQRINVLTFDYRLVNTKNGDREEKSNFVYPQFAFAWLMWLTNCKLMPNRQYTTIPVIPSNNRNT